MPLCLNGEIIDSLPADLDRAIYYGDTLFETIRVYDGQIPLLQQHWKRLTRGLEITGYDIPSHWNIVFFENAIRQVCTRHARVRFTVWRSPGGLYLPTNNQPQYMVQSAVLESPYLYWTATPLSIGICQSVKLPVDQFSNIKTMNGPRYVQAALEARKMGWDDGLVLNQYNRICEATSSNFFWWMPDGLFTIALTEGCVAGVMRNKVIETARAWGIPVFETQLEVAKITDASEIFLTNALRGIVPAILAGELPVGTQKTEALLEKLRENILP